MTEVYRSSVENTVQLTVAVTKTESLKNNVRMNTQYVQFANSIAWAWRRLFSRLCRTFASGCYSEAVFQVWWRLVRN